MIPYFNEDIFSTYEVTVKGTTSGGIPATIEVGYEVRKLYRFEFYSKLFLIFLLTPEILRWRSG
jgi:hypothetical protein